MKKPDLIKQLANRINQPHVVESWINKIEKAAYNKGFKDAESKQCNINGVSNSSDLYVVELSDEEIKIIDQKKLDEWYKSAEEFDGILGFIVRGKLMK